MEDYGNIYIVAEENHNDVVPIGYELVAEARRLVEGSTHMVCVIFLCTEDEDSRNSQKLIQYGADLVYRVFVGQNYFAGSDVQNTVIRLIKAHCPEVVLFGATVQSRELASVLAARLDTGLTADCIKLSMDWSVGELTQIRPAYEGNLLAAILCKEKRPQMATVRPGVMKRRPMDESRYGKVVTVPVREEPNQTIQLLEEIPAVKKENQLFQARIVLGIGHGIASRENVDMLKALAAEYGIAIGATRPVVDSGLLPESCQIGLTGGSIQAEFYIACGISGAIQHLSGIQNVRHLIAINQDRNAPIFQQAQYGIVGDAMEILPQVLHQIYATES